VKHDLLWFEEYAECADFLEPLTPQEWKELAALLHEVNSVHDRSDRQCAWDETDHIRTSCGWIAPLHRNQGSARLTQCPNCRHEISYTQKSVQGRSARPAAQGEGEG